MIIKSIYFSFKEDKSSSVLNVKSRTEVIVKSIEHSLRVSSCSCTSPDSMAFSASYWNEYFWVVISTILLNVVDSSLALENLSQNKISSVLYNCVFDISDWLEIWSCFSLKFLLLGSLKSLLFTKYTRRFF